MARRSQDTSRRRGFARLWFCPTPLLPCSWLCRSSRRNARQRVHRMSLIRNAMGHPRSRRDSPWGSMTKALDWTSDFVMRPRGSYWWSARRFGEGNTSRTPQPHGVFPAAPLTPSSSLKHFSAWPRTAFLLASPMLENQKPRTPFPGSVPDARARWAGAEAGGRP